MNTAVASRTGHKAPVKPKSPTVDAPKLRAVDISSDFPSEATMKAIRRLVVPKLRKLTPSLF